MMRRRLAVVSGLLAALAAAYVAASWYAGRIAQRSIESWVTQADQQIAARWNSAAPRPVLRVASYERGWFGSQVTYVFEYHDPDGATHSLGLHDALLHGPWPWEAVREGHWRPLAAYSRVTPAADSGWQGWFALMQPGATPWVARSLIGFEGDVTTVARVAPVQQPWISFDGATLNVSYRPEQREIVTAVHFDALKLQAAAWAPLTFVLQGADLNGRTRFSGEADHQVHQEMRLARLDVTANGATALSLRDQSLVLDAAQTGSLADSRADYRVGQLQAGGSDLGQLQAAFLAQNLSMPALQALSATMAQIQAGHAGDASLSADERQRIRDDLVPVLAAAPRFALETLRWTNAAGKSELSAHADFQPVDDAAARDPGELLEQGIRELALELHLSRAMVLQVVRALQPGKEGEMAVALASMVFDQGVGRLQRQGLVTLPEKGLVQVQARYAGGQVTLNGVTMTPAELSRRLGTLGSGLF